MNDITASRLESVLNFLRRQKMQVTLGDSRVLLCSYVEPADMPNFHWVMTPEGSKKVSEQQITILL